MIISLINHTNLPDMAVQQAIRAVNISNRAGFLSLLEHWRDAAARGADRREFPTSKIWRRACAATQFSISKTPSTKKIRSDSTISISAAFRSDLVFTEISGQMGEPWQVTLSHEALELIADAEVNRLIIGPHPDPAQKGRMVFHWYEMCDAVVAERCISPTPSSETTRRNQIAARLRAARHSRPLPTGRVPGSRVRAVPLIKSQTGRAKEAGGRRERSSG